MHARSGRGRGAGEEFAPSDRNRICCIFEWTSKLAKQKRGRRRRLFFALRHLISFRFFLMQIMAIKRFRSSGRQVIAVQHEASCARLRAASPFGRRTLPARCSIRVRQCHQFPPVRYIYEREYSEPFSRGQHRTFRSHLHCSETIVIAFIRKNRKIKYRKTAAGGKIGGIWATAARVGRHSGPNP